MATKTLKTGKTTKTEKPAKKAEYQLEIQEYNKHPILNFQADKDRFAIQMGVNKIKAVLDNLEACQNFVASNGKSL